MSFVPDSCLRFTQLEVLGNGPDQSPSWSVFSILIKLASNLAQNGGTGFSLVNLRFSISPG